jgi:hypothetical protein
MFVQEKAVNWIEKLGPLAVALSLSSLNLFVWQWILPDSEFGRFLVDRATLASLTFLVILGMAITLVRIKHDNAFVIYLRNARQYPTIINYCREALLASSCLLIASTLVVPLGNRVSPILIAAGWMGTVTWALLATVRSYIAFAKLLSTRIGNMSDTH